MEARRTETTIRNSREVATPGAEDRPVLAPRDIDKLELGHLLANAKDFPTIFGALNEKSRLAILSALLKHEAYHSEPMTFSGLMAAVSIQSSLLSHHLKPLMEAGLIEQLARVDSSPASRNPRGRSFYRTTNVALALLRLGLGGDEAH